MTPGQKLYEWHRDEMLGYDIPVPTWGSLSATARRGWESRAAAEEPQRCVCGRHARCPYPDGEALCPNRSDDD
jgi:hypothetical protein